MPYKQIEYEKRDVIARVILSRPQYRNAHSHHMLLGVGPYLREADQGHLPKRMPGVGQALDKLRK